jgi:hypothetical protein
MTTSKISPAQQRIIDMMEEGMELSSHLSLIAGETQHRFADITNPDGRYTACKNVHIATIDAMLEKSLIVERKRWISSTGEWYGKPHESWRIVYQLPPDKEPSEECHHWPAGAKVVRKGSKDQDTGVTLDETWQNWNGKGHFNRVRWQGSGYTSTVRADRLKRAEVSHE